MSENRGVKIQHKSPRIFSKPHLDVQNFRWLATSNARPYCASKQLEDSRGMLDVGCEQCGVDSYDLFFDSGC